MKKNITILLIIIVSIILFSWWFDNSWKNSMQRDYYNLVLKDIFTNEKIYLIERYKSNNKIHGFYLGSGSKYYCFTYENGFDEFVRDGDKLSKKSGDLRLKVTKPNKEEKTFTFEIKECDKSSIELSPAIYVEEHLH